MACQWALVANNGEVQHVVSSAADDDYTEGEVYHGLTAVQVAYDADPLTLIQTQYRVNGTWATREARTTGYQDWTNNAWVFNSTNFWIEVRRDRDGRLGACDWTQSADSPVSDSKKAEWATYRTGLRNVPASNSSITDIDGIAWPTEPS